MSDAAARAARIRLMVLDVDGVLTDGRLYFGPQGEALKAFDVRDGHGIKLLMAGGVEVAILTARRSEIVAARMRELGVARVLQGQSDKRGALAALLAELGLEREQCGYMGDDLPDLGALQLAGFAAAPADAAPEVLAAAHWVAPREGGRAAVRAAAEFVLRAQERWDSLLASHVPTDGGSR
ncbi:MAG TPA: HAD hydrolase family protein [Burkholderiaceae bacterium]|jgi:3-deoxy-D-manno-octulosonate 8-phosphate phosphatase (KDO 8-P phosphatase)|nr:HAD hydrolase family protein [Burkholderiaceae bacterium]HPE01169.1 HAD hydrolase family protein [Burkholderiaceae bacterium]HRZ00279.1 HAD hydrolase family protein [Burkholderiaceae bacterium]